MTFKLRDLIHFYTDPSNPKRTFIVCELYPEIGQLSAIDINTHVRYRFYDGDIHLTPSAINEILDEELLLDALNQKKHKKVKLP